MKLSLNGRNVWKYIGMIVFEVVYDQRARAIMHEFCATIEIAGVVFVGFNDKEWAVADPRGLFEIIGCTAN